MGTVKDKLKKYGVTFEQANRQMYLEAEITKVRQVLDKTLHRLYMARRLARALSPKEKKLFDELLKQRAELVEQIDGLYKLIDAAK